MPMQEAMMHRCNFILGALKSPERALQRYTSPRLNMVNVNVANGFSQDNHTGSEIMKHLTSSHEKKGLL